MNSVEIEQGVSRGSIVAILPCREPITGGIRADLRILDHLSRRGWSVDIVPLSDRPGVAPRYRWRDQLGYNVRLVRLFRRVPDGCIVLEDQALSSAVGLFNWYVRRCGKTRVVLITHHTVFKLFSNPLRRILHRMIEGTVARGADLVIAQSQSTRRDLLSLGVLNERIRVVPFAAGLGPVSGSQFARDHAEGAVRLLSAGTVQHRKGLDHLVRALSLLRDLEWSLDVIGAFEPAYQRFLAELARSLEIADRIHFHGRVTDEALEKAMWQADILVHPSLWEGFGLAVLEAMERGLPVVASSAGALPELIDDGETGLLVPPGDAEALAAALRSVIVSPRLRETLGRAAAKAVRDRYSWEETARHVDAALSSL